MRSVRGQHARQAGGGAGVAQGRVLARAMIGAGTGTTRTAKERDDVACATHSHAEATMRREPVAHLPCQHAAAAVGAAVVATRVA